MLPNDAMYTLYEIIPKTCNQSIHAPNYFLRLTVDTRIESRLGAVLFKHTIYFHASRFLE